MLDVAVGDRVEVVTVTVDKDGQLRVATHRRAPGRLHHGSPSAPVAGISTVGESTADRRGRPSAIVVVDDGSGADQLASSGPDRFDRTQRHRKRHPRLPR